MDCGEALGWTSATGGMSCSLLGLLVGVCRMYGVEYRAHKEVCSSDAVLKVMESEDELLSKEGSEIVGHLFMFSAYKTSSIRDSMLKERLSSTRE
jgi:hypothetical protein